MLKPWCWLPPKMAHDLAPYALNVAAFFCGHAKPLTYNPLTWRGLHFPNRLGVAGGVDKTGQSVQSWWRLGAGFVELGTVTPLPQSANPGKILARDPKGQFLWNRMGFPSLGADAIAAQLRHLRHPYPAPLFINVGKNRDTSLSDAARDYLVCIEKLRDVADAFVLNVSSPNTQGLRHLLSGSYFGDFLSAVMTGAKSLKPILIKLSPDMSDEEVQNLIATALPLGIAGFVLTNTTTARPSPDIFPAQGGFSGSQVRTSSLALLKRTVELLGAHKSQVLIVSVGGVASAKDVQERLSLGADLVQAYTALVFQGPLFFRHVIRDLES